MYLKTVQEMLLKAPSAAAARSALIVLAQRARDADFEAIRCLTHALASELGYEDAGRIGRAESMDHLVGSPEIPLLFRSYALGFWPQKLLHDQNLWTPQIASIEPDETFLGFQRLVRRENPMQHEALKAHVLQALLHTNNSMFGEFLSRGATLRIIDRIRDGCCVIAGSNADADFNFGRDLILNARSSVMLYSVIYHELGHHLFDSRGLGHGTITCTLETAQQVTNELPRLLENALKLKGKQVVAGTDPRRYLSPAGLSLLWTYQELSGHAYTHFSLTNAGGPIELPEAAAWAWFILSSIGADCSTAVAAYSPRGVFHFGVPGTLDLPTVRQRIKSFDIAKVLPDLPAASERWLAGLAGKSRMGRSERDVPFTLGVPRPREFFGPELKIVVQDRQICEQLRQHPDQLARIPPPAKDPLLCLAVRCGDPAVVRSLLAAGASPRARLPDSPATLGWLGHSLCVVRDEGGLQYHGPSLADLLEVINTLGAAGLDLNEAIDTEKNTLLHLAAGKSVEATQFLLERGVQVDAINADGRTPLGEAVDHGDEQIVRALLRGGAGVGAANHQGETALMLAAGYGRAGLVKLLCDNGADPEAADALGRTPLHFAAASPRDTAGVLDALLAAGGEVDEESTDGTTPLMAAAEVGNLPAVKFLIANRAKVNAADQRGNTALMRSLRFLAVDSNPIVQALLEAGADPLHRNADGQDAQKLAGASLASVSELLQATAKKERKP